jgi:tRNA pseudouridine55 synthase
MSDEPHGVLIIDKPQAITSHDAVAQARRLFQTRSVGHAGTLDPMATGVLVLLFGEACKLSNYLSADAKTYLASVRFGVATDSYDADGEITQRADLPPDFPNRHDLERALQAERQRDQQIPPAVSAIHDRGVRAHVRVRRGEAVELNPRPVHVHRLELRERNDSSGSSDSSDSGESSITLELCVSKGYYVRSLARDLGDHLGAPAHLTALRRISSGAFTLEDASPWPLEQPPPLLPLETAARRALPVTQLTDDGVSYARQGKILSAEQARPSAPGAVSAWFAPDGKLIALGVSNEAGHKVVRGFR